MSYTFRPMIAGDLPLVQAWLATPAVARWWDGGIEEQDLAEPGARPFIVCYEARPFAYLQDYDPHAHPGHHFAELPSGSRGIDQFIGEADMLDRGHGSSLIRAHVQTLFRDGAPVVATDPHPDNARAIRAYEKVGFTPGETRATEWGLSLLMTRYRP